MKFYHAKFLLVFSSVFICLFFQADKAIGQSAASLQNKITDNDLRIENILKHSMFIKVFTSSNKIFVGEPVMALYKFYTSLNGQAVVLKQPEYSGCSVSELNFDETPQTETIDGKTYTTFIVRKVQLTPVEPGNLSMGTATVTNHIELSNRENALLTDRYDIPVSNVATYVAVAALPDKNKPADFYGITGVFSITAIADKKIPVDENDHLIITIKGAGNLDAINNPQIAWPKGTEHFDGTDSQHVDQTDFPISGDKIFDIPFIGKKEGTVTIPSISFSYFNTTLKDYRTISTDSIAVTFTKALSKKQEYSNVVNYDISNRKYLWIVAVIALSVALIGFISYKRNKIQSQKKLAMQQSITPVPVFEPAVHFKFKTDFSRYWADLESLTDVKLFFAKAKELLLISIKETTDVSHPSEAFLLAALKQKVDNALYEKLFALLNTCDAKMYAPFDTESDLQLYSNEVKQTIEVLQATT